MTQVATVAYKERGVAGEIQRDLMRGAATDRERDPPIGETARDVLEPLQHEAVMAGIRLGVVVHEAENDGDRQVAAVGLAHGIFERRIKAAALRLLHPIKHEGAAAFGPIVQPLDARGLDHVSP